VWSVWTVTRVFMQVSAAVAAHTSLRKAQAALLLPAPAAARLKANGFFCHTAYKSCLSLSLSTVTVTRRALLLAFFIYYLPAVCFLTRMYES
jgi:hypothetical protein